MSFLKGFRANLTKVHTLPLTTAAMNIKLHRCLRTQCQFTSILTRILPYCMNPAR